MAQSFTARFPNNVFEIQQEACFVFPDAKHLPFIIEIKQCKAFIKALQFGGYSDEQVQEWTNKGLKDGLRIVSIGEKRLASTLAVIEAGRSNITGSTPQLSHRESSIMCQDKLNKLIAQHSKPDGKIVFTLREDIQTYGKSEALGLEYNVENERSFPSTQGDATAKISTVKPLPTVENNRKYKIANNQISVNSFNPDHPPHHVRLNNKHGYWRPSVEKEQARDIWICVDLLDKKCVDKIQLQGNQDHSAFVQSFWIDCSDDGCTWNCHQMGEITCEYKSGFKQPSVKVEYPFDHRANSVHHDKAFSSPSIQSSSDLNSAGHFFEHDTASIKVWPIIRARFIRIRPSKWKNHIALRMELYGNERPMSKQTMAVPVTLETVPPKHKEELRKLYRNKTVNEDSVFLHINCRESIRKAMDSAGCTTYSMIPDGDNHSLLHFTTVDAQTSELVMDKLTEIGVGVHVGVISATAIEWRNCAKNAEQETPETAVARSTGFTSNIKSHKATQIIVNRISGSATMNFDYVCMLLVASCIAVGGLATNSSVAVIASMLVSPIMGPVLAFTFGSTLGNQPMLRMGFLNECFSLIICVINGFIIGFIWSFVSADYYEWPTVEMESRGEVQGLASGAFIAAASGVGVALTVMGDYMSTIVGVAISASLLPPAVNSGMLLAFTCYETMTGHVYSTHGYEVHELMRMTAISFILTIENIFIIFVTARLMFWLKNIHAKRSQDDNAKGIWHAISKLKTTRRLPKLSMDDDNDDNNNILSPHAVAIDMVPLKKGTKAANAVELHRKEVEHTMRHTFSIRPGLLQQVSSLLHDNSDEKYDEEKYVGIDTPQSLFSSLKHKCNSPSNKYSPIEEDGDEDDEPETNGIGIKIRVGVIEPNMSKNSLSTVIDGEDEEEKISILKKDKSL